VQTIKKVDTLAQQKAAALRAKIAEARAKQAAKTTEEKPEFNKNLILPIAAAAAIGAGFLLKGRRG
jgi:hypothetical protein